MNTEALGRCGCSVAISPLAAVAVLALLVSQYAMGQTFTVLHNFTGGADGSLPSAALTMDRAGNLYGTTTYGGSASCAGTDGTAGCGVAFKLTHTSSGWIETPLYYFQAGTDGAHPASKLVFGPDGALYGTTPDGGESGGSGSPCARSGCGTVYRLTPPSSFCHAVFCPWNETVIYRFTGGNHGNDYDPSGTITFDAAGNIYGTTGGSIGGGEVYELSRSGGVWAETILFSFNDQTGEFPGSGVILDTAGNIYGTLEDFPYPSGGAVYQLTKSGSIWTENILHAFQAEQDGGVPIGGLIFDHSGSGCLLGTTSQGPWQNQAGSGTVFSVCPQNGTWVFNQEVVFQPWGQQGPKDSLVQDSDGNVYGTWVESVFKLGRDSNLDLHDFDGGMDGGSNYTGLIMDANGNLYGTAAGGTGQFCTYGCGIVYEITQ